MLSLKWQTEYALLMIQYLDKAHEFCSIDTIASDLSIPKTFSAQIASQLAQAELLESKEGRGGGYKLVRELSSIRLSDVIALFEKEKRVVACQTDTFECPWEPRCGHRVFFKHKVAGLIWNELDKWSLKDVFQQ